MIDKYEIAARVAVAGLDGFDGRMCAADQRRVFGGYVFGRKQFRIDASGQGRVSGSYSSCFGTDSAFFEWSFDRIAGVVNGTQVGGF